jgi:hypothetical protein
MLGDINGSTEFLAEAAALSARLDEQGRSVFDVRYDGHAFGSWVVTAGTSKRRIVVTWDGRDGRLVAKASDFPDSQAHPTWSLVAEQVPVDRSPSALLRAAELIVLAASGAPAV